MVSPKKPGYTICTEATIHGCDAVKDPYLADHTERIEQRKDLRPGETRDRITSFIEARYTLPQ